MNRQTGDTKERKQTAALTEETVAELDALVPSVLLRAFSSKL
jgi:hypothetical protein